MNPRKPRRRVALKCDRCDEVRWPIILAYGMRLCLDHYKEAKQEHMEDAVKRGQQDLFEEGGAKS